MRKLILKLLLKLYTRDLPSHEHVDVDEEMQLYRFKTDEDVEKLLKVNLTQQIQRHFNAKEGSDEKLITKGSGLILKIMLDSHRYARDLDSIEKNKQGSLWRKHRNKQRTN